MRNSALIDNNGVCNLTDIAFIQELIGGTSTFRNDGTFNKSGGETTTTIRNGLAFLNNGTVNVDAGTLELPSGTSSTGTFAIDGGTTLIFAGSYTMDAASSVSGAGAVQFAVGPVAVNGAYAITGVTTVSGTVAFNTETRLTKLDLSGTLTGTGHVTVGTALNWTSGTMSGNGTTTVASTVTLTMSGNSSKFLSSRTLVNDGTATLSGGILEVRDSALIDNNGVWNVTDITEIRELIGGNSAFRNDGTFNKSGAGTTTTIGNGLSFTNNGTVNVASGTLQLAVGGTSTGDWDVASAGVLKVVTGSYLFDGGTDVTGAGMVVVTNNGTLNVGDAAADVVNISNLRVGADFGQGTVTATGTLHVSGAMDLGFNSGTGDLGGSGDVTIGGLFTWFRGTMSGSGTTCTTSANGGILFQGPFGRVTIADGRHFDNNGTATWADGAFEFKNGAVFNNNGTLDIQVNSSMGVGSPAGAASVFNNNGIVKKTGGASDNGATTILVPFNNHGIAEGQNGAVDVQVGTLTLRSDGTSTGPWTVAAPAILDFASGTWNFFTGSTVSGAGIGRFEFAVVNLADTYTVDHTEFPFDGAVNFNANSSTKTLALNSGTLGGSGDFTVSDSLTWHSGRMTGAGTTVVNGDLTLDLGFPSLIGRRVDNNGTATWTGNSLSFSNGAVFNNNGTFDDQIDNSFNDGGGAQSLFNNNGTFRKSVLGGTTTILTAFTNNGTIDVQTGALSLNGPSGGLTNFPVASTASIEPTGATESGNTVTITTSGHQFLVVGQTVTISGVAEAGYNGTFTVTAVPSQSTFQYTAATGGLPDSGNGSATFLSDSTLTGGTYLISGTLQFTDANIVTNAANIVLNGPEFGVPQPVHRHRRAGELRHQRRRRQLHPPGRTELDHAAERFGNAGVMTIAGGSTFAVGGTYTQTTGTTTLDGTLAARTADIQGGLLQGSGTVNGDLTNAARLRRRRVAGHFTINGGYTQTAAGSLDVEVGGPVPGTQFDQLVVTGPAALERDDERDTRWAASSRPSRTCSGSWTPARGPAPSPR